jgi:hypothetical protein
MKETTIRNNRGIDKIYDNVIYIVSDLLSGISAFLDILRYLVLITVLYPADVSIKILGIMIISITRVRITRHDDYRAPYQGQCRFGAGHGKSPRLFMALPAIGRALRWSNI